LLAVALALDQRLRRQRLQGDGRLPRLRDGAAGDQHGEQGRGERCKAHG
jgi:hypothetical protein